ncbi:23058_t:CDS:1 [Entrophospora sp. SA101]|nr:2310_t:CDS:1 [Entrophospora candida]CAG8462661.1 1228_t:CDS:1 [Entrophospora candida]CAJ0650389.1 10070_t:CDS:1 [Entrophospora sp. SA101]CAJ0756946.1 14611_t:CDS:1 [Entrophospora sp. SA101]CAJ0759597.1 23058_t:CDS:1 [Entrophospora sp. SA101]
MSTIDIGAHTVAQLFQLEQDFQFLTFDNSVALELGLLILKTAQQKGLSVVISIMMNQHLLFHYSMPGTKPIDVESSRRKANVVNDYHHSSLYVKESLKQTKKIAIEDDDDFNINKKDYLISGGAFPLIIKGVGVVGSVTVSGYSCLENHEIVVSSLKEFFGLEKEGKNKVE